MMSLETYLKKHTEALVKDVGIEAACTLTGKSKATLGHYYSDQQEHDDRFKPIDVVAQLEAAASFPHVTSALADLRGIKTGDIILYVPARIRWLGSVANRSVMSVLSRPEFHDEEAAYALC